MITLTLFLLGVLVGWIITSIIQKLQRKRQRSSQIKREEIKPQSTVLYTRLYQYRTLVIKICGQYNGKFTYIIYTNDMKEVIDVMKNTESADEALINAQLYISMNMDKINEQFGTHITL